MKKTFFALLAASLVLITACSGLGQMKSNSKKVRYQANPDPVEVRDGKVVVNFTGQIPAKYFYKGAAMFIQPVFSWEGGNTPLDPITIKGESVSGPGSTINYTTGGRFTYNDALDYKPGMETGRVTLAPVAYKTDAVDDEALFADDIVTGHKGVVFPTVLISDGVNITSEWIDIRGNISIAPLNYNKKQGVVETADIYFPNGTSALDWNTEMNVRFDARNTVQDLRRVMLENGLPKQITITGWSSPEGEESANVGVSKNRADVATAELRRILDDVLVTMAKRAKVKPQDLEYYKHNELKKMVITTRAAGEDWVHFVIMVVESTIQDKHAIVNVAETQQNLVKREQMIKNYSETYPQLENTIFPSLRRAQIALYYSEARKTDQELAKQATLNPAKLSFDELMYAAYINYNYDTKMKYYKWATENHSAEWGAWNNAGAIAFYLGDYDESERYLKVARDLNPHNPDVLNNTGLLCMAQKDYTLAKYYFEEAQRQGSSDAEANLSILTLKRGDYEAGEKSLKGNACSYNLAFAQLMNDETDAAIRTLNCCLDQTAEVNYLRAVCYARLGDHENTIKNLQASVDMNYDYKRKAAIDTEFRQYWNDEDFKLVIKLY